MDKTEHMNKYNCDGDCASCDIDFEEEQSQEYIEGEPFFEPIPLFTEYLPEVVEFNTEQFQKGLDDISYICGKITGLVNVGLSPIDALGYLVNMDVLNNSIEISKIQKDTSVEVAKNQTIQIEKNSL